ncbi:LysR substrate-binding domain-containing protein [Paraburkholderia xenovorans]|uniref:LysR substrate-binding domain-containing protein n=1 Tax=Paraburkholderia xenovorans TaxID=36873 RepID=UPI0038B881DF
MRTRKRLQNLPSLDFLRGFDAAARHLSFTKAGQELNVTQSAVSRQVKTLEDQLGIELFHRHIRALTLTENGRALHASLAHALIDLESAIGRLSSGTEQRSISISTTVSFSALWLIPRLGGFRLRHPGIDVRVSATSDVQDLKRKRMNLAVRYVRPDVQYPGAQHLFDEQVVAVCSPSLIADSGKEAFAPTDLGQQVLLHMDDTCGTWPWYTWDNLLDQLAEPHLKPAGGLYFSQYDQLIQAAVDGHGVALGRRPLINGLVQQNRLVELFPECLVDSGAYCLIAGHDADADTELAALTEWLLEEAHASVSCAKPDGPHDTDTDSPLRIRAA